MSSERIPQTDASTLSRPLAWLTIFVVRFPAVVLLLAAAGVGISIWLTTTRMGFHTSRAELLNPKSDYNRRWIDYTKEFGDKEDVVVVVEGEGREQIVPALDDLCRNLATQTSLFAAVLHNTDAPKLRQKGLYYLDLAAADPKTIDLQKIEGFLNQADPILQGNWSQLSLGNMAQGMGAAMAGGSDAQRQQMLAAMQAELPRMMGGLTTALGQSGQYQSPWPNFAISGPLAAQAASTRLISDDGRMGFILLQLLEEDNKSFAQNNASITALRTLIAEVKQRFPAVQIGLTGLPIIEYDEMRSSEQSMSLATILSFLGVLAVIVVAFGGFRHSVMAMVALVVGMVWACGCITLTVGHVNILSIAFGSILFGLGIDYGIYYVARYLQLRETIDSVDEALVATASSVGPGITTGAVTSAIAFFAAGLTEFPGVAQLGIIAGGGILLCWLAQMTVLPAMIRLSDKDGATQNLPAPLDLRFWLRPLYVMPRLALGVTVIATLVLAVGMHYLRYDYNLLNLQPVGLESVKLEHKLFNQTNRSAWFALSIATTPEEAVARKNVFLQLPGVERVEEVASKIPGDAVQKQPIIARIQQRLANLPTQTPQIPVTPLAELDRMLVGVQEMVCAMPDAAQMAVGLQRLRELLRQMPPEEYSRRIGQYQQAMAADLLARLHALRAASNPELPQLADLPESVLVRSIGKSGRYLLRVYSKANIWDVAAMGEFVRQVRSVDPEATGNPLQVYEASRQMKRSYEQAAWYALLAILPAVFLDFRRFGHTLLAALPMGIGMVQTFGLMGLLDIPLNPANMIVLPLVLGIGMESGINLVHDLRCQGGNFRGSCNSVLVAVVVNSLTTMVGFGALMIANHQGLQSLGRVLTISMGCCLLSSLILPNLLLVGRFAAGEPAEQNPSRADDSADIESDDSVPASFDEYYERYSDRIAA